VSDRLRRQIAAELAQLSHLIEVHGPLLDQCADAVPGLIEISALGAMIHSFYNGVENIFKRIALELDGELPSRATWHRDLLDAMARPATGRPAVISESLQDCLKDYLNFRHVFRSAYSFLLEWERMAPLVLDCRQVFETMKAEIEAFTVGDH
jgi:hypothetical protein